MGSTKTENESNTLSGSVINSAQSSGNVTAKNYLKESLSSILLIQGNGSSWKRFDPEILVCCNI